MEILVLITGFAMCLITYRLGLRDGQALKREQSIKPIIKSPVKAVQEAVSAKKEAKNDESMLKGIENLLSYDGTPQKGDEK